MSAHTIVKPTTYLMNAVGLACLMTATIIAAYIHLTPPWGTVVAVLIAITKATLVVLFFMNVYYSTKLTKIFVACAFFWLVIMFGILSLDYLSRSWVTPAMPF